jgi:hypothetical protein
MLAIKAVQFSCNCCVKLVYKRVNIEIRRRVIKYEMIIKNYQFSGKKWTSVELTKNSVHLIIFSEDLVYFK